MTTGAQPHDEDASDAGAGPAAPAPEQPLWQAKVRPAGEHTVPAATGVLGIEDGRIVLRLHRVASPLWAASLSDVTAGRNDHFTGGIWMDSAVTGRIDLTVKARPDRTRSVRSGRRREKASHERLLAAMAAHGATIIGDPRP